MTENATIGLEFDRDGAVASFEQALDEMRRRIAELEAASQRVDFDNASESAARLRDRVREAADAVVSMAQRSTAGLELTEQQTEQISEAMATTKRRVDALGDSTGPADLRAQLDLVRSSSDRLNTSLAGAQAAGQTGSGAAAGGGAAGRFSRITAVLGPMARAFGAAGAAAGTFFAVFRQTRGVIRDLEELAGIDIDGFTQRVITGIGEATRLFDTNRLSAQDLENQWRFLAERGIEVERTAEGIAKGFDELQRRQDDAATAAQRYRDFLGELIDAQAKSSPKELSQEVEDLAVAFREAEERGDDLLNGPLGEAFRDRVSSAQDAIRRFDAEIRSSLSGEDLERYEKFRAEVLNLDAAVEKQAESQKKVAQQQDRIRESGDELASDVLPRLTEETDKNAEASERAAEASKAYAAAQREQLAAAQEQAGAADTEVERLERQRSEIENVVALGDAQDATMEQIAAASQVKGELFQIERQLEQAIKDQQQATSDLEQAQADSNVTREEAIEIAERMYGVELDGLGNIVRGNQAAERSADGARRGAEEQGRAAQQLARDGAAGADALGSMADESQRFAEGTSDFESGANRRRDSVEGIADATESALDNAEQLVETMAAVNEEVDKFNGSLQRSVELLTEIGSVLDEIASKSAQVAELSEG